MPRPLFGCQGKAHEEGDNLETWKEGVRIHGRDVETINVIPWAKNEGRQVLWDAPLIVHEVGAYLSQDGYQVLRVQ